MFSCQECGKVYSKQNSLTRHLQNHKKTKHYICHTCDIAFYRRDLLARHSKMHQPADEQDTAGGSQAGSEGQNRVNGRRRCHTACIPCREHRIKCDGQHPCQSCIHSSRNCEFSGIASRVSRGVQARNIPRSPSTQDVEHTYQGEEYIQPSHINSEETGKIDDTILPSPNSMSEPREATMEQNLFTMEDCNTNFMASQLLPSNLQSFNQSGHQITMDFEGSQSMAWPWIHENIFLHSDWPNAWTNVPHIDFDYSMHLYTDQTVTDENAGISVEMSNGEAVPAEAAVTSSSSDLQPSLEFDNPLVLGSQQEKYKRRRIDQSSALQKPGDETPATPTIQSRLIEALVTEASQSKFPTQKNERHSHWSERSKRVQEAFKFQNDLIDANNVLQNFVDLYLQNFAPLWPLLSKQDLDCDMIHPVLYLVLTSIGAMYGGASGAHFGTMLHERLRKILAAALGLGSMEGDFMWLAQARCLTQVAALYFGQSQAFTYAQHIGGVLVAQARRMNLFSSPRTRQNKTSNSAIQNPNEQLSRWIQAEERRRLAFGILRAETYTSVLLNTRPLVSPEEIDLDLPCSDRTWRGPSIPSDVYLAFIERDQSVVSVQNFSDNIRIALERAEEFPTLDVIGHELLLFGLQQSVWRFAHDYHLLERLTDGNEMLSNLQESGLDDSSEGSKSSTDSISFQPSQVPESDMMEDHLISRPKEMNDQKSDWYRLTSSLRKWKRSFKSISTAFNLERDRNSLLSSLLLYHLSFMRLQAPVEDLHYISYRTVDKQSVEADIIDEVTTWANSTRGYISVRHAIAIWTLISREVQRPEISRAKFNFLAFLGLHHTAVVIWTYGGAHNPQSKDYRRETLEVPQLKSSEKSIPLKRDTTSSILRLFPHIFNQISPGSWSSFAAAATRLSQCDFPGS